MLIWQYDRIIGQLILLQDHAADPTCPCTLGESGEYCTAKHLLAIQEYATETMQMVGDEKIKGFLNDLSIEAREHRDREKALQCGIEADFHDLAEWSRAKRKFLEPLVYKSCEIPAKHRISQEPGAPEAGVQKGMFGHDVEFRPQGKGRVVQIDMLEHARLQGMKDASGSSCQLLKAQDTDLMPWFDRYDGGDAVFAMEPIADRGRKLDGLIKQLREGINAVWESDNYSEYLRTLSKFHNYSLGNCILIWLQRPDASRVAGFQTWKNLGRYVKKGEKAITILAPCVPAKPKPAEPVDAEDAENEPDVIEVAARPMYFKPVSVFDISQTDGKEIADIAVPSLSGDVSESLWQKLIDYSGRENVAVDFSAKPDQNPEIKGTYYPASNDIWIKPDEPRAQQAKTLAHELAHHNSTRAPLFNRSDEETIAESVAFVVCGHFGFDTGIRTFPYVALWAGEEKRLRNNLSAVRAIADKMIDAMEALPRTENNIAENILKQLGGRKFIAMTGAKHIFSTGNGLSFKLPKGFSRHNINYVKIVLLPSDTYSVEFSSVGPAPKYNKKIISSYDGLYADQLQDTFKTETGLDTALALHRTAGVDDLKAELDALLDDLNSSRAGKLIKYVKHSGNYKGELSDLTPAQFKELTGKAPNNSIIDKRGKIPAEYAIDFISSELGFQDDRELKREVERVYDLRAKIEDVKHRLKLAKDKAKEGPQCSGMIKTVAACIDPAIEGDECKAMFLECDDLSLAAVRHPAHWTVHKLEHENASPSDKNEVIAVRYAGEASREMKDIRRVAPGEIDAVEVKYG